MMNQIGKALQRGVALVAQPVTRVFRQVQRQRTIGAEQPEEVHQQPIRPTLFPCIPPSEHRGRELNGRLLRQA